MTKKMIPMRTMKKSLRVLKEILLMNKINRPPYKTLNN